MHVFWAKGYEGASLSNLTRAMRINGPFFTLPLATRSNSLEKFSIDTWTGRSPGLAKLWRHRRRGMSSNKYSVHGQDGG